MKLYSLPLLFFALSCSAKPPKTTKAEITPPTETVTPAKQAGYDFSQVVYTKADSAKVVRLLHQKVEGNPTLFYARQFIGVPYVAYTLEVADPEKLVVNLTQLDCTTLIENALTLAKTYNEGGKTFADYCRNLESFRYFNGKRTDYLSRLHYFAWWMHDNIDRGNIREQTNDEFSAPIVIRNHYMSTYSEKYKILKKHPEFVPTIRALEKKYNGADGTYLPQEKTLLGKKRLSAIEDGDLVAIVTKKAGLDYSHLGIAVWGKDGKLHLLNASSIHKKVVEEPMTIYQYLQKHPSSIGIRTFRLQ